MRLVPKREPVLKAPSDVVERASLAAGEKVLAAAETDGCWLLASRIALHVVDPAEVRRIPWERVDSAGWDRDTERFVLAEVAADDGRAGPSYRFALDSPERLLQLVRERVTASIVLQRRHPLVGKRGLLVSGRRPPTGGEVVWRVTYDAGIDPADPAVADTAARAVDAARAELG